MRTERDESRIVVTGSTGFTGGLVARELAGGRDEFVLTGRDEGKVRRVASEVGGAATAVVDVTEPETLRGILEPGDVVINVAGPFTELGEPVVETCVAAGAHYLDTTGEQRFMERIHRRHHDGARDAGVAVVNAMAFEFGPGDAACALACRELSGAPSSVEVTYGWHGEAGATSPGTRASVLGALREPALTYDDGAWKEEPVARHQRAVRLPDGTRRPAVSFPAGEVVTVPRYAEVERVRAWMITGRATALAARMAGPILPPLVRLLSQVLEPILRRGPEGPDPGARQRSRFTIVAEAWEERTERPDADARARGNREEDEGRAGVTVTLRGRDPYGLTAALVVAAARRLAGAEGAPDTSAGPAEGGRETRATPAAGVLAPSQLLPARGLLDGLRERGFLEWDMQA